MERVAERIDADLCIIGGGTGGLVTAAIAARLGARTVLFERDKMGGDCLNQGCVPSKALLATAKAAKAVRDAGRFGIATAPPMIDFAAVMRHVRGAIAAIAPHDSAERFERLGVSIIRAAARFVGEREVAGGGIVVRARRFAIAAGSSPAMPPIAGLDRVDFLTNETLFDNPRLPEHLIVIGGGPVGLEMAQAHRLLGSRVTVIDRAEILAGGDPELVCDLRRGLQAEGIEIRERTEIRHVEPAGRGVAVILEGNGGDERIEGSDLLVAAGRRPNVEDLDLAAAGVAYTPRGITVDRRLRTSNQRIYALGDIAGGPQFTHLAEYHAGIVIRNALFRLPARTDYRALPWVLYTDPELAQVGSTEEEGRRDYGDAVRILRFPFDAIDRVRTDRESGGAIKIVAHRRGHILGAAILGPHAGELIHPWALAIGRRLKLSAFATMIAPYPTLGEIGKRAAGEFYAARLFGPAPRRLVRFLAKFG